MFLKVIYIGDFIEQILTSVANMIYNYLFFLKNIVLFNTGGRHVTLFHFFIGITVLSILIGAFVHINSADEFYK